MACLRHLRHHPIVLAVHPSACGVLALAGAFTVSPADTAVDRDVGCAWRGYCAVAKPVALLHSLDLGARGFSVCSGISDLPAFRSRVQRSPTRRPSCSCGRASRSTAGDVGYPRSGSPSCLSGTSLPDAGLERRHGIGGLLWADGVCSSLRHGYGPIRRPGARAAVWTRIPTVPAEGASRRAQDLSPEAAFNSSTQKICSVPAEPSVRPTGRPAKRPEENAISAAYLRKRKPVEQLSAGAPGHATGNRGLRKSRNTRGSR